MREKSEVGLGQLRFSIIRSPRRRTLQLSVGVRGVEVRAPFYVSDSEIGEFVLQKKNWIERALNGVSCQRPEADVFSSGGVLFVLGQAYTLEVGLPDVQGGPLFEELPQGWRVKGDAAVSRRLLVKWYRLKAEKIFEAMIRLWAVRIGVDKPRIVVKEQERLWGSYSSRTKAVNLNWRMIAFPPEIIEYIVIHELCHAKHLNHSRSFWREVEKFCPDWRSRRLWLRVSAKGYLF